MTKVNFPKNTTYRDTALFSFFGSVSTGGRWATRGGCQS